MPDRDTLVQMWEFAWAENSGWTPFTRALEGLSHEQAAWRPAPGRHSIWLIVKHLAFWSEYVVDRARGGEALPPGEIDRRNWEAPGEATAEAWGETVERYGRIRAEIRDALADPALPIDHLGEMLTHHAYHVGQIMQLRALQGLDPIV